jgi:hypothetical protein
MVERKSPIRDAEKCSVKGCNNPAERSIPTEAALEAGLDIEEDARRAHLCKEHYKSYKKGSKSDRTIGSLGH